LVTYAEDIQDASFARLEVEQGRTVTPANEGEATPGFAALLYKVVMFKTLT